MQGTHTAVGNKMQELLDLQKHILSTDSGLTWEPFLVQL